MGGYIGIHTRGAMLARYRPWVLLMKCFFVQVALLGVSDHYVKKNHTIFPWIYVFKVWRNGLHTLNCMSDSYRIQIPLLGCSLRHCPPCLRTRERGVGGKGNNDCPHHGPNPKKVGRGGGGIFNVGGRGWILGRAWWRGQVQREEHDTYMIT